jgi:quinol monooxygenase YgiN
MIALVAVLRVKPGMEEKVKQAILEMTAEVRKHEKNCSLYEPYMPVDGKAEIHVLEKYTDLEALAEHRKTAHYLRLREQINDTLAEPPSSVTLEPLCL